MVVNNSKVISKYGLQYLSFKDYISTVLNIEFSEIENDVKQVYLRRYDHSNIFSVNYSTLKCITTNSRFTIDNMKTAITWNNLILNVDYRIKIELNNSSGISSQPWYTDIYYLTPEAFSNCLLSSKFSKKYKSLILFFDNTHMYYTQYIELYNSRYSINELFIDKEVTRIIRELVEFNDQFTEQFNDQFNDGQFAKYGPDYIL